MNKFIPLFFLAGLLYLSPALAAPAYKYNFRFEPVLLAVGYLNGQLDYKLNQHITVGPAVGLWSLKFRDVRVRASSLGAQGRYYFNEAYTNSWLVMVSITHSTLDGEIVSDGTTYSGSANGVSVGGGGGYHWFWNRFNMGVGGYLNISSASSVVLKDSQGHRYKTKANIPNSGLGVDFSLGWNF